MDSYIYTRAIYAGFTVADHEKIWIICVSCVHILLQLSLHVLYYSYINVAQWCQCISIVCLVYLVP